MNAITQHSNPADISSALDRAMAPIKSTPADYHRRTVYTSLVDSMNGLDAAMAPVRQDDRPVSFVELVELDHDEALAINAILHLIDDPVREDERDDGVNQYGRTEQESVWAEYAAETMITVTGAATARWER